MAGKKEYIVTMKMDTDDFYLLKAKALSSGYTRSEYIRRCIRSNVIRQRLSTEHLGYIRQLSGMANNVNQIARKTNATGFAESKAEWTGMANRLDNVIKRIEDSS